MYGIYMFLHLGGLILWLGSIVTVSVLLIMMKKELHHAPVSALAGRTVRVFQRITHPSSFLVLLTGILMLLQLGMENHDSFPFWLLFMEQAGSIVILAFIIALSILGRKVAKRLAAGDRERTAGSINAFIGTALAMAAAALAVVFIVSGKF